MRALDEAATTEEELRLALMAAREEASALATARDEAEAVRADLEANLAAVHEEAKEATLAARKDAEVAQEELIGLLGALPAPSKPTSAFAKR